MAFGNSAVYLAAIAANSGFLDLLFPAPDETAPMVTTRPNAILRVLFLIPTYLYRLRCGWLLGHRFLLLVHVGRRTRRLRYTVLEILEFRRQTPEVIVMSAFGPNADWLRNIEAAPCAEVVVVGSKCFAAVHRVVKGDEAAAVIAAYERRNWFFAGVVRAVLSRLLGWRYDGSEGARRKLVTHLPLIAFRPILGDRRCGDRESGDRLAPHELTTGASRKSH